ncbi:hypothetical protein A0J57_03925 [Sphingobium sp. 22B]|uniref:hypothetical protein n=1 Tax=unclassified Sphingobium TaxID=2611147 RepID=UPI00078449F2|nr:MULTISPECIES: hypothetical protein [unclassified Sphingobium]KXU33797.1 hypothetical protein AXW74_00475 [Sphingobium sp. AM]KYC33742.1 hypothetical protein A0J57_03925 [Sphingobium sp. 22B]OAP33481.1 hypothetical protein A8O16_03145 [Sphingobium sp. 20006FA]
MPATDAISPDLPIPRSLSDITPDWINRGLAARFPGIGVKAVRVEGFVGHKPNKAVVYLDHGAPPFDGVPQSVFVKGSFKADPDAPKSGLDVGNELELLSYEEVVPFIAVNTPDCYAMRFDQERCEGVAILKDIHAAGAVSLKERAQLEYDEAAAFIDSLARTHAPWLGSAELEPGGRFGPGSPLVQRTLKIHESYIEQLVKPEYWDNFVTLPRGEALPRMLRDASRMAAAMKRMHAVHRGMARTVIHGDEHLGNLYLEADGTPGFLDWCARVEAWPISFSYFLVSVLDTGDRRNWERPLLARYIAGLKAHGAVAPSFEEAWYAYRCTIVYSLLIWLNNSSKWQPEAVNTRNAVRAANALLDHDVFRLLGL